MPAKRAKVTPRRRQGTIDPVFLRRVITRLRVHSLAVLAPVSRINPRPVVVPRWQRRVFAHGRRRLLSSRGLVLIESVSLKPSSKGGDADRVTCGSGTVPVSGDDSYQTASSNN
jgi:hypothetical protein